MSRERSAGRLSVAVLSMVLAAAGTGAGGAAAAMLGPVVPAGTQAAVRPAPAATVSGHRLDPAGSGPWTRERMLNARPADLPGGEAGFTLPEGLSADPVAGVSDVTVTNPSASPWRLHGKVFFSFGDVDYVCSGTVVSSRSRSTIFTAGHCVYDPATESWARDLAFVPGYSGGNRPFGTYLATNAVTTRGWIDNADARYDIGAATLGGRVQDRVGARGIAFNTDLKNRSISLFGYPQDPSPYDGESLVRCSSALALSDPSFEYPAPRGVAPCDMRGGASGGGWIIPGGYLAGLSSYHYCDSLPESCGILFGPRFEGAALNVYRHRTVGGSLNPTVRITSGPPARIRKRRYVFRFAGSGSTPVTRFRVRLDSQRQRDFERGVVVSRLSLGRHVLKVRSIDQTGRLSPKTVKRVFRVLPGKKRR